MIARLILAIFLGVIGYMLAHLVFNEAWSTVIGVFVALIVFFGDKLERW